MPIINAFANDYGSLAYTISNLFWSDSSLVVKDCGILEDVLKERFSDYDTIKNRRVLVVYPRIPGCPIDTIYLIDRAPDRYARYYRSNNSLFMVGSVDMSIGFKEEVTMEEVAEFTIKLYKGIELAFNCEYVNFADKMMFIQFTVFATLYYKFRLEKDVMFNLAYNYGVKSYIPNMDDETKCYENCISLIYSRKCSESMIIRCIEDGINGVEPDNILKSRIVQ